VLRALINELKKELGVTKNKKKEADRKLLQMKVNK
jgi:hypothetical protein